MTEAALALLNCTDIVLTLTTRPDSSKTVALYKLCTYLKVNNEHCIMSINPKQRDLRK